MVTKSTVNYSRYKDEVRQYYMKRFPNKEKDISNFMQYVSKTYDYIERTFFPYKYQRYLFKRRENVIKKNQHFWIAFIGRKGGEGKSTFGKQTCHFLDKTFHSDIRTAQNFDRFIEIINDCKRIQKMKYPSILLDEVDPKIHHASKDGRLLRSISTKIRQLNLFVGVCANSLLDVPSFVYERLTTIVYINDKHRWWLWDNNYDKPKYSIIEDIKEGWKHKKHGIFLDSAILSRAVFKNMTFSGELPFEEKLYDLEKAKDLFDDIDGYMEKKGRNIPIPLQVKEFTKRERAQVIAEAFPDFTDTEIGEKIGTTREWVNKSKNLRKIVNYEQAREN